MEWLERHRGTLAAFLVILVAVAAMVVLQIPRRPALQVTAPSSPQVAPSIKVHVTGAVLSPGVVQLPADARIDDALKAAGGVSPSADMDLLNLASPLKDGQRVVIPEKGVPTQPPSSLPATQPPAASGATQPPLPGSPASTGLVNLNTANQKELEALPGIGPVTAQKILDYRQSHGGFRAIEELRDNKLVNAPTYEKLRGLVEAR